MPFVAVWSTKGGVGVSTVAAMLAIGRIELAEDVLMVDLCGDLPALFGIADPEGPGVADWCATPDSGTVALHRIESDLGRGLYLVHRGRRTPDGDPAQLIEALAADQRCVIVDCGRIDLSAFRRAVVAPAPVRILVVRACYLTLRSVTAIDLDPTGVVLLRESRRALTLGDVEATTHAPVVAEIAVDPSIARSIDAGLLASRLPRRLVRSMARVLDEAA